MIAVIPAGHIYCMVAADATMLHWSYGCDTVESREKVAESMGLLFASWPSLHNIPENKEFYKFLKSAD